MHVALVQLSATTDSESNREAVAAWMGRVREDGRPLDLVVLPEASMHDFGAPDHDLAAVAEPIDGPYVTALAAHAQSLSTHVIAGMFEHNPDGLPWNTLVCLGPDGDLVGTYRKLHLYDSFGYRESDRLSAAPPSAVVVDIAGRRVGLMTCYDVRFPEHSRLLVDAGADTLCVPAAWVRGRLKEDHWITLLRARAIENTVYVLGAGQTGRSYVGCSVVVDPMGVAVAQAGESETIVRTTVDAARIAEARQTNPSLANRRLGVAR